MPITAEQKAKIKEILAKYRRDASGAVKAHKQAVAAAVTEGDKQKAAQIKQRIGAA